MYRILHYENNPILVSGLPNGFKKIGCNVEVKWFNSEKELEHTTAIFKPHIILTSGIVPNYSQQVRSWIRDNSTSYGYKHIHWDTDGILWKYLHWPFIQDTEPIFVFTMCSEMLEFLKNNSVKAAPLDYAYNPEIHHPIEYCESKKDKIALVGNAYQNWLLKYPDIVRTKSTLSLIKPFADNNIQIDIWGHNWNRIGFLLDWKIPEEWLKGHCFYQNTKYVYTSAAINLCLQNHEQYLTKRTYEILGSEGFALTYDTPAVRKNFKNGKHLAIVSSPGETLEAAEFYMKNPGLREKIRKNGRIKVEEHTYENRARYMLKMLQDNNII